MPPASIAAAERRVIESRQKLRGAMRRVGARLARPSSLLAAAAAGAVVGFSVTRLGGAGALARGLAAAALRHGAALYVRYRTARDDAPAEDAAHG
jgi:phytoene dehydrogenase-like protein